MDIYGFYKGEAFEAYEYLGAHLTPAGTVFRTYAPNASKVAVVGDFNGWKDEEMKRVADGRFFELTCPAAKEGMRYKYRIYDRKDNFIDHADPYGFGMEMRPNTCSVVRSIEGYKFADDKWLARRSDCRDKPPANRPLCLATLHDARDLERKVAERHRPLCRVIEDV